ncbi:hypothetical protein Scep_002486 [Stephania cephalantha]|uniref:Uncharacterized protein n=1 Tax=Stephania cephalantha TaxID=152367 RepID=A0AAP0LCT2_9MAGN
MSVHRLRTIPMHQSLLDVVVMSAEEHVPQQFQGLKRVAQGRDGVWQRSS